MVVYFYQKDNRKGFILRLNVLEKTVITTRIDMTPGRKKVLNLLNSCV